MYWLDGISLILKSIKEKEKQKAWEIWLTLYPHMTKDTFIPFSKFYKETTEIKPEISPRTAQEILNEAKEIRKKLGKWG